MVAVTTLYGPTEMIDGGFLWVKRCWALAVARGLLDGGIPWFTVSNVLENPVNSYLFWGAIQRQSTRNKRGETYIF